MARVARLAGAILVESGRDYFLVGNLKRPCDFAAAGFEPPAQEVDALVRPYLRLSATREITLAEPWLVLELEGEALAQAVAQRLLISRTGSVSDRLWRLVVSGDDDDDARGAIDARWLGAMPERVWNVVRDTVLKCS